MRLAKARQKIESLLERLPGIRIGLVAFSGGSALSCPLTLDHAHFKNALLAVDTNTIDEEGTNIADALALAKQTFQEDVEKGGEDNKQSRAVLLISDGEQISGDAVSQRVISARWPQSMFWALAIRCVIANYPEWNRANRVVPRTTPRTSPSLTKRPSRRLRSKGRACTCARPRTMVMWTT